MRQYFIEPRNAHTNRVCSQNLLETEVELRRAHPNPVRVWRCTLEELKRFERDKANLKLSFRVWIGGEGEKLQRFYMPKESSKELRSPRRFQRNLRLVPAT